jgi:hypothetical protein
MHRTQLAKAQSEKRKNRSLRFPVFFDCLDTAKLFTNCKFCVIFVALIPVMNYYA